MRLGACDLIGFVPVTDGERALRFYVDVLGLEFVQDDGFAVVLRAGGRSVRLARMEVVKPASYTVLGWEVPEMEATVGELAAAGGEFLRYPGLDQDAAGVWTTPSGSKVAWLKDPDGNVLSLSRH